MLRFLLDRGREPRLRDRIVPGFDSRMDGPREGTRRGVGTLGAWGRLQSRLRGKSLHRRVRSRVREGRRENLGSRFWCFSARRYRFRWGYPKA